jgi:hypothetical protein
MTYALNSYRQRRRVGWSGEVRLPKFTQMPKVVQNRADRILDHVDIFDDVPEFATNVALSYAESQIGVICEHAVIAENVHTRMLECLRASLLDNSVFPSITTDGYDGLIAQWKASNVYVALELSSDGSYSFIEVDESDTLTRNDVGDNRPSLDLLQSAIKKFTAYVSDRNPDWSRLYA